VKYKSRVGQKSSSIYPFTDAIEAYVEIRKTHDALHRHVSKKLTQWGLSVPKYGVLVRLYDHESLPLSDLSRLIFRGNSNMTTLITRMERDGLVERFLDKVDGRVKKIHLTDQGRTAVPGIIREYRSFLDQMLKKAISPEEQRVLMQLLKNIKNSIEEAKG
jgi:DNA-binding MarR family transcriptional regulator